MSIRAKTTILYANVISYIHTLLSPTNTPPQVDGYKCKNRKARAVAGSAVADVAQVTWIDGAEQEKDGKRKADKEKADKAKRENDKGLRKTKPPKRDGLAPIL